MPGRVPPVIPHIESKDDAFNRLQQHLRQTLDPIRLNPLFQSADYQFTQVDGTPPTFAFQYRASGSKTWTTVGVFASTGALALASGISPGTPAGAQQSGKVYQGSGVPSNTMGANGDVYFRTDTPGTANQRMYIRSAGTWTGIV